LSSARNLEIFKFYISNNTNVLNKKKLLQPNIKYGLTCRKTGTESYGSRTESRTAKGDIVKVTLGGPAFLRLPEGTPLDLA